MEQVVRKMTLDGAALSGLHDRGRVAAGKKADLNLTDFDRLQLHLPELGNDLPAGARRALTRRNERLEGPAT